jgi:hypothetical protein
MSRPGHQGRLDLDEGLRETTVNSILRWKRRLEGGRRDPADFVLTEREANQLRAVALERGAVGLAEHLERVATLCKAAPNVVGTALSEIAKFVDLTARASSPAGAPLAGTFVPAMQREEERRPAQVASTPPPALGESVIAPPSMLFSPEVVAPSVVGQPPPLAGAPPPRATPGPSVPSAASAESALLNGTMLSSGASSVPAAPSAEERSARQAPAHALPESVARPIAPPKLLEGTFLGFRAFNAKKEAKKQSSDRPADARPNREGLLGLRSRPSARLGPVGPVGPDPSRNVWKGLGAAPGPAAAPRAPAWQGNTPKPKRVQRRGEGGREWAVPAWAYWVGGSVFLLAVSTVVVIVLVGRAPSKDPIVQRTPAPNPSNGLPVAKDAPPPSPSAPLFDQPLPPMGPDTPELRALIETQNRMAKACRADPSACGRGWTVASRDALNPIDKGALTLVHAPEGPAAAWLHGLKSPPDFPVHDEPALRQSFDYDTKNIAGRQSFQAKLFECSAYSDIFDSTLTRYGAPHWLIAVVYQESGCNHLATSEVGARGLWQFMPESARAYGLRVVDGEIDERLNPVKSTDAAVHFLTDLQRKFGAWDLALAAYNMGPFGVLARIAQVGESAGFWELSHAGLLPDETAGYVPAIESDALVLANLTRLQFNPYGKRLESTSEIIVKPGMRLSMLARAASTTTVHIRDLNPEFLRDVVPEGENSARVPDSEAHRAQAFVDSWSPDDNRDTCVPQTFDWGAQQFETSRYAANCAGAARDAR